MKRRTGCATENLHDTKRWQGVAFLLAAVLLAAVGLIGVTFRNEKPVHAAGIPFTRGQGMIFVSQGSPTRLYESVQLPGTNVTDFKPIGDTQTITYNALGFNPTDMYLYAINSTTNRLIQIDSTGATTGLGSGGSVTNLPALSGSNTYNGGTIGSCLPLNTLWVTPSTAAGTNTIYSINVANTVPNAVAVPLHLTAGIGGHSTLPNVADIVCMNDGVNNYLWAVYGAGPNPGVDPDGIYRINTATGVLDYFSLLGVITSDWGASFGAQWFYGNGNLGISNNQTGNIHQIQIDNPSSATPTFTEVAILSGPASTTNDGASYAGEPVDLDLTKTVTTDHGTFDSTSVPTGEYIPGSNITYTLTVENVDPLATSSGFFVTDTLDAQFTDPSSISFDSGDCYVSSGIAPVEIPITIVCTSGVLNPGETQTFNMYVNAPATLNTSLTNTATVTGNEEDPDPGNDTSDVTIDAATSGYVISKSVVLVGPGHHAVPGEVVEYTITITNTGETAYCAPVSGSCPAGQAEFVDDLSDVLDDATPNYDFMIAGINIANDDINFHYTGPGTGSLDWVGELAVGETKTVTYSFTITTPGAGSNRILNNSITATHAEGGCGGVCSTQTIVGDPGFSINKSVDKATITPNGTLPNDWVNYTIAVTNTGTAPYTSHHPASIEDDLSDVFDDAVFGNVLSSTTGRATISGSTLSWSGPIAVGATTYITYQVRVSVPNADLVGGNMDMTNAVAPVNSEGTCANCVVSTEVIALTTPPTPITPPPGPGVPGAPNTGLWLVRR